MAVDPALQDLGEGSWRNSFRHRIHRTLPGSAGDSDGKTLEIGR